MKLWNRLPKHLYLGEVQGYYQHIVFHGTLELSHVSFHLNIYIYIAFKYGLQGVQNVTGALLNYLSHFLYITIYNMCE